MKTGIPLLLLAAISIAAPAFAKKKEAKWQPKPIVADGSFADWNFQYYPYDDNKAKIQYAYSNDGENLYLTIKTGDQTTQRKIMRGGLNTFIDVTGKKKMEMALHFPMANDHPIERAQKRRERPAADNGEGAGEGDGEMQGQQDARGGQRTFQRENIDITQARDISLSGFHLCNGLYKINDQDKTCGVRVSLGLTEYNELVWEAVIPLKLFLRPGQHLTEKQLMNICFEINGLKMPEKPASHGGGDNMYGMQGGSGGTMRGGGGGGGMGGGMGGGGMRSGGGGMRGGGGRGGMRGGMNDEEAQALAKTTKTWLKIPLATHP